jgi:hypothetical protein
MVPTSNGLNLQRHPKSIPLLQVLVTASARLTVPKVGAGSPGYPESTACLQRRSHFCRSASDGSVHRPLNWPQFADTELPCLHAWSVGPSIQPAAPAAAGGRVGPGGRGRDWRDTNPRFPSDGTNSHAPQLAKRPHQRSAAGECLPAELIGNQAVAGKDLGDTSIGNPAKRKTATQQPRPVLVCRSMRQGCVR